MDNPGLDAPEETADADENIDTPGANTDSLSDANTGWLSETRVESAIATAGSSADGSSISELRKLGSSAATFS